MKTFPLQIVTPDGEIFRGQAQKLIVRTIAGDVGILPNHADYVTALGMGQAKVVLEDATARLAACIGGLLTVTKGSVKLVATTFEWAENIDLARAERSKERAESVLTQKEKHTSEELALAEARLKRALVRSSVGR